MRPLRPLLGCLSAFLFVLSTAAPALAGPLDDGLAAYKSEDYATAARLLTPEAEAGGVEAQYVLGMIRKFGLGRDKDPAGAAEWLRKAADQGHAEARYELAQMYLHGNGLPQDDAEAAKL
ncbi:MAG: tetratricopeptide repeat protein, partial [Desulfovibrionaceae bacterium]|nr:tetratricopeptide repeat protein [Desulfovibrionaceae bacterium]